VTAREKLENTSVKSSKSAKCTRPSLPNCACANPLKKFINLLSRSVSIRVGVSAETVEYDVSPWFGMEEEQLLYKQSMDQLIPVLYDILSYLSKGFNIELVLSFVSTKSLPYVDFDTTKRTLLFIR
ncbi:hypothetical protein COOONC_00360, partial [Cooperia oncophora]